MTNYAEKLAMLDTKAGRVHTLDDWTRVRLKVEDSPETVTDDDLTIIGYFDGPGHVAGAVERRRLAIQPALSPAEARAVTATKITPAAPPRYCDGCLAPDDFADVVIDAIKGALDGPLVKERFDVLEAKLATMQTGALEQRIAELEARPSVCYRGTFKSGDTYATGDVLTHQGSAWICTRTHRASAAFLHDCFKLLVKAGRDGRDLR